MQVLKKISFPRDMSGANSIYNNWVFRLHWCIMKINYNDLTFWFIPMNWPNASDNSDNDCNPSEYFYFCNSVLAIDTPGWEVRDGWFFSDRIYKINYGPNTGPLPDRFLHALDNFLTNCVNQMYFVCYKPFSDPLSKSIIFYLLQPKANRISVQVLPHLNAITNKKSSRYESEYTILSRRWIKEKFVQFHLGEEWIYW